MTEEQESLFTQDKINTPALISQEEAAKYLGTTVGTLNSWRYYGKNKLPFVRWGNRIRYRKQDLDAFIEIQTENKIETI